LATWYPFFTPFSNIIAGEEEISVPQTHGKSSPNHVSNAIWEEQVLHIKSSRKVFLHPIMSWQKKEASNSLTRKKGPFEFIKFIL
jgi:hypothetical protein